MSWKILKKGDVVDILAPGFATTDELLKKSVQSLKKWGLVPRVPEDIFGKDLLCANTAEKRFEQLRGALQAEDSKAIWFLRGGYGSLQLLPFLKKMKKPGKQKLIVGFSDITSLHLFFTQEWGWSAIHGPVLSLLTGRSSLGMTAEMKRLTFGQQREVEFRSLKAMNDAARKKQKIQAKITGGNLTVAASHLGTDFAAKTKGKILFFEEVGERAYRIDRLLRQWQMAGAFSGVKAIIFGQFIGGKDPDGKDRIPALLKVFAEDMKIPVFKGLPCGHEKKQRPLPLNTKATLSTGEKAHLICQSGCA